MQIDIRLPSISAKDPDGKVAQLNSYLVQLAGQLQYAMGVVDASAEAAAVTASQALTTAEAAKGTPQSKFQEIKGLIIKSADIVQAYSEEIATKLESVYVAVSDFGEFREDMSSAITESAQGVLLELQDFQQIQAAENAAINDTLGELDGTIAMTNAYIRTGKLYEDGAVSVYGVEIGQTSRVDDEEVFSAATRIVSGRMSFMDGSGNEVAWISDSQLHITDAQVRSMTADTVRIETQLQIGDYIISADSDGHLSIT